MSSLLQLPPGMVLVLGALLVPFLRGRALQAWVLLLPVLSALHLWQLPLGHGVEVALFDFVIEPVRVDRLSRIWGVVFHLAAMITAIYSLHERDRLQHAAGLAYAGSAIGAVFAGDLVTLFTFWELTAVTSVWLVWASRSERSLRAGVRYLLVQVGSGVLLLAGLLLHLAATGDVGFGPLSLDTMAGKLIFVAFGIKAAFPLLHNWLQDAYPEATVVGTVYLSSFTTKLAIYALARSFAGTELLIPIGVLMTAFPIFYAIVENDLRRVLAYSLNNQLGYMVVGIGIGTELAINGAAVHAFAHILYKGLLFMSMGAVLHRVGTAKGSELGGLWRSMPLTMAFCIVGAMTSSAFPLFAGFVSKSLIVSAASHEHLVWVTLALIFAGAGVFLHAGIKVPYFAFFAHDSGIRTKEAPLNMLVAMGIAAVLCVGIGVYPGPLYALLPFENDYVAFAGAHSTSHFVVYTPTHTWTQLQLLLFSALAFVFLQKTGLYPPELRSTVLDTDWVYRRLVPRVGAPVLAVLADGRGRLQRAAEEAVTVTLGLLELTHGRQGPFSRAWPPGLTAFFAAVLLVIFILLGHL